MSIRVSVLKSSVAVAAVVSTAIALSGCSSVGRGLFGDNMTTGSTAQRGAGDIDQPMPTILGSQPATTQVAKGPYVPPADIGSGGAMMPQAMMPPSGNSPIVNSDLPVLAPVSESTPMSAQPNLAPVTVGPKPAALGATQPSPALAVVESGTYYHTIESGESLYSIARRYDVTAQAIIQANGFSSPDKIYVGQKIMIPGRAEQLAVKGPAKPIAGDTPTAAPVATPVAAPATTAAIADPQVLESNMQPPPAQQAQQVASLEPKMSGAEKFRWPVSGKVITDFAASKGTGINIEAPEGAAVRAAENGTVIYVGSGVEGYGNLILIRHPNGFVSAYAHLKAMSVSKGQNVNRGDNIGQTGMTGSVNKPQLHFELRKGATPVDPVPHLAS
jgi:murein DD-endopeptidase MepM/ murein hydrolase activator NlpD